MWDGFSLGVVVYVRRYLGMYIHGQYYRRARGVVSRIGDCDRVLHWEDGSEAEKESTTIMGVTCLSCWLLLRRHSPFLLHLCLHGRRSERTGYEGALDLVPLFRTVCAVSH